MLKSEACTPSQLASKLPPKSPCYTFYSYPTPAPSAAPATNNVSSLPRNTFQASQGGARLVNASSAPTAEPESTEGEVVGKKEGNEAQEEHADDASVKDLSIAEPAPAPSASAVTGKGRILFIYTCPSGSPIKFRMVYSSGAIGMQQDAKDKIGIDISGKVSLRSC